MYCLNCGKNGKRLCTNCKNKLITHPQICPICHKFSKNFEVCLNCKPKNNLIEGIMIAFRYNSIIKNFIFKLKYFHKYQIAKQLSTRLLFTLGTNEKINFQKEKIIITYVPSHRIRHYFVKGYNQSKILAKTLSKLSGLNFQKIIRKTKKTKSQAKLNKSQRHQNLKNTFQLQKNINLKNETIIIIDDVTTTGSTILEIAKTIKNQFPNTKIRGLVVARNYN